MKKILRGFIELNKAISKKFDSLLAPDYRSFGTEIFDIETMPAYLKNGATVFDIGGGKNPNVSANVKAVQNLRVIGMDIDESELNKAPDGLYDAIYVTDITKKPPDLNEKADVIICRALMEHVRDTQSAIANISSMLKPGGVILIFVPNRHAIFSRLNLLLPEKFKVKLLQLTFPEKMHRIGFKAYYNHTTPAKFEKIAQENGLEVEECRIFWASRYLEVLFPVHIIWRLYQMIARGFGCRNLCETFIIVLKKP